MGDEALRGEVWGGVSPSPMGEGSWEGTGPCKKL